jgi:hypothetical protein
MNDQQKLDELRASLDRARELLANLITVCGAETISPRPIGTAIKTGLKTALAEVDSARELAK